MSLWKKTQTEQQPAKKKKLSALFASKKSRVLAAVLLLVLAAGGSLLGARYLMSRGKTLPVISVQEIADTWSVNEAVSYGVITSGGQQNVFANSEFLVDQVFVSVGQSVKAGQELLRYDITLLKLTAESRRISYEMAKNELAKARQKLEYYKTFKPYTEPPIVVADTLTLVTDALFATTEPAPEGETRPVYITGKGTADEPYVVACALEAEVEPSFLTALLTQAENSGEARHALLQLYATVEGNSTVVVAQWRLDTDKFNQLAVDALAGANWALSKLPSGETFLTVNEEGAVSVNPKDPQSSFGTFQQLRDSALPDPPPYEESLTQQEIDALILEQTQIIRSAEISVKQSEIDYKKARNAVSDGTVYASMDGVVTHVGDPAAPASGEPFITVQTGSGYSILSSINELQLDEVAVGDTISIMLWSTGENCDAVITSISDFPAGSDQNFSYRGSNPNSSQYTFTAELNYDGSLYYGEGGEISFPSRGGDTFALENMFIREENGRSYVLVAGANDRIEKRYVEIGRNFGYAQEILSGLTLEDYIGFPYGKNAVEGAHVNYDPEEFYNW